MFEQVLQGIRSIYGEEGSIPLHAPVFAGNEKAYLARCIDTTFVSSVGEFVNRFEAETAVYTGAAHAVAVVNGTAALHVALLLAGVEPEEEVLTQSLTFVATCNAIRYAGARPRFIDVDRETLGLSPDAMEAFLEEHGELREEGCFNKATGGRIAACVPMHTFGHPARIREIAALCETWRIPLVEDSAESLGSYAGEKHTGTFGLLGCLSYNGNKVLTTGGGGMILTDDEALARRAKHLTTTAKIPHPWEYDHDQVGFNYRMPNLNAALGCAQLEQLEGFLDAKRTVARHYADLFREGEIRFLEEPEGTRSNYWLNALLFPDRERRDLFLEASNRAGVMTRPIWTPMHRLAIHREGFAVPLPVTEELADRVVNIPSGVPA